jgi:hypothetical protein
VSLSPTSVTFADTAVGTSSNPQTVTVTNGGNENLVINSVGLTGTDAGSFGIPPSACLTTLAPGASCSVDVTFKPTAAGAKTAALTLGDNAAGGTQNVSLTGNGVTAQIPAVSAPVQRFTEAGMPLKLTVAAPIANSTLPIAIRWSPVGTNPIDHYELQSSTNGAAMTTVSLPVAGVTSYAAVLKVGGANSPQTYQYQVRACATAGTASCSAYAAGPTFTVSPLDDTGIAASSWKGTWKTANLNGAYGGSVHWSSTTGSSVGNSFSFNVTGNVAIASTLGPDRGKFKVDVDGTTVAPSVDLYAPKETPATVPTAIDGVTAGSHTVTITALGTQNAASRGSRVDLDGFIILK